MKLYIILLIFSFELQAKNYLDIKCSGWGTENTFELQGELDESGANFLDALISIKAYQNGILVFEEHRIDSTGFYWLDDVDQQQVYLAELVPLNRTSYGFLSIAANHPRQSGNSYLTLRNIKYQAECYIN